MDFFHCSRAPARRALENNGITSLQKLSTYSEKEILQFHGMGPASLPKLRSALKEDGIIIQKLNTKNNVI